MEPNDVEARRRYLRHTLAQLDMGPLPETQSNEFIAWMMDRENFRLYMQHLDEELIAKGCAALLGVGVLVGALVLVSWNLGQVLGSWRRGALCLVAYALLLFLAYVFRRQPLWLWRLYCLMGPGSPPSRERTDRRSR